MGIVYKCGCNICKWAGANEGQATRVCNGCFANQFWARKSADIVSFVSRKYRSLWYIRRSVTELQGCLRTSGNGNIRMSKAVQQVGGKLRASLRIARDGRNSPYRDFGRA